MEQTPTLTVTLNPALDFAGAVQRMDAGPKLRLTETRREPGGGGVNAARVIRRLAGDARATVGLAGSIGSQLRGMLEAKGSHACTSRCRGRPVTASRYTKRPPAGSIASSCLGRDGPRI